MDGNRTDTSLKFKSRVIALNILAWLVLCLVPAANADNSNNPVFQDRETERVIQMIKEFSQSVSKQKWLEQNSEMLTLDTLEKAKEIYKAALPSRNINLAAASASFASFIGLHMGRPRDSLNSYIDYNQVLFMIAESLNSYEQVRSSCLEIIPKAKSINDDSLVFRAAILASDCSFFILQLELDHQTEKEWRLNAVNDLALSAKYSEHYRNDMWFQRFISLLSAISQRLESRLYFDDVEEKSKEKFEEITGIIEKVIPVDFKFSSAIGDNAKSIYVAQTLGGLSYRYGNPSLGSARLYAASRLAAESKNLQLWIDTVFLRYINERDLGTPKPQLIRLRNSLRKEAENLRGRFLSKYGRIWASHISDKIYGELTRDQLKTDPKNYKDIFQSIEALKARTLLDLMTVKAVDLSSISSKQQAVEYEKKISGFEASAQEDSLIFREMKLASQLSFGTTMNSSERAGFVELIEALYKNENAGFQGTAKIPSLEKVRNSLAPGEAIIEYFIPFHQLHPAMDLWIFVVTKRTVKIIPTPLAELLKPASGMIGRMSVDGQAPIDTSPLGETIISLRTAIQKSDEQTARQYLNILHRLLILPLLQNDIMPHDYKRWIIVPHGILHYVPFAALLDGNDKYLIESVATCIAPSASVWYKLQKQRSETSNTFIAFSNPALSYADLPPLINSEKEVSQISEILSSSTKNIYKNDKATETNFRNNAPGKNIIHISTHGDFPMQNAMDFHQILLASGDSEDGRLQASEIRNMDLNSARLAVISICNGGLYNIGPSDEPYGLIPAFLIAGAENILGTLWPVEDRFAGQFTVDFYKHLQTNGPAEALRKTCMTFIEEDELVRRWSGFVLVGGGRPFKLNAL